MKNRVFSGARPTGRQHLGNYLGGQTITRRSAFWRWAEQIGPEVIVDQRSAHEFIGWVARETGLDVRFEDETVEQLAHATRMSGGNGSLEPRTALAVLLQTTTLEATIENGSIYISER